MAGDGEAHEAIVLPAAEEPCFKSPPSGTRTLARHRRHCRSGRELSGKKGRRIEIQVLNVAHRPLPRDRAVSGWEFLEGTDHQE